MKTGIATALIALVMPVCVLLPRSGSLPTLIFWYWTEKSLQLVIARCGQHRTG
jgi:hypothetical protein